MADDFRGDGAAPFLAFLVGGLMVAVVVLGFFVYEGRHNGSGANMASHLTLVVKPTHNP